jgi:Uncharacterised protein conserved in bacteria (DUF2336)
MRCIRCTNQKRSDVPLAKSSNGEILTELDDRPGADMTARLLLGLTALYVQRASHTAEEQQQYIELALRLIDKVEGETRTAVARILQRHPDAPAEVVARLGGDLEGEPRHTRDQHFDSNLTFGEAFFAASVAERRRLLSAERDCHDVEPGCEDNERRYGEADAAPLPGRISEFASEFGQLIDIPASLWERILNDPSGEPLVVAAKATGMPIAILQRILLLVSASASYSVQRVYDLTDLYHGLDSRAARHILALWRTQARPCDPIPETGPHYPPPLAGEGRAGESLRSRFNALTARVQGHAVNARAYRGSVAQRGLRSR